jgi:hypothetical protein
MVEILAGTTAILTEAFCGFPQYLEAVFRIPQLG